MVTGEGGGARAAISVTEKCEVEVRVGRMSGAEAVARDLETSKDPPLDYGGVPSLIVVVENRSKKHHESQLLQRLMLLSIHPPFIPPLDPILLLRALQQPSTTTVGLVTSMQPFLLLLQRRSTMPETRPVGTEMGLENLPTLNRTYFSSLLAVHDLVASDPVMFRADRPTWTRAAPVAVRILMGQELPEDQVHPPMTRRVKTFYP